MKALFLGGCLLTTKTVEREQRFINVLLSGNPELQIDLARYSSYALVEEILASQSSSKIFDRVVFLVRPFPFYTLTKLFPRVPGLKGGTEVKINPGLFSANNNDWFRENDRLIVEMDWNPNGTKRSYTHAVNLLLGAIFKLDIWAIEYVKNRILALNGLCMQKNIRFIVVGPPAVMNNPHERRLLNKLNLKLKNSFEHSDITYINLFSEDFPKTLLGPDRVHYNGAGHSELAKKIEEKIFMPLSSAALR
jgi:hypothetical protein